MEIIKRFLINWFNKIYCKYIRTENRNLLNPYRVPYPKDGYDSNNKSETFEVKDSFKLARHSVSCLYCGQNWSLKNSGVCIGVYCDYSKYGPHNHAHYRIGNRNCCGAKYVTKIVE
jgi:hypothetical protein